MTGPLGLAVGAAISISTLVAFVSDYALLDEEPRMWALPVGMPWSWLADMRALPCRRTLVPTAFLASMDATGAVRVEVRELDACRPWEGGETMARVSWLPLSSGELEGYLLRLRSERAGSLRLLVAPHDALAHEHVIAFLDVLLDADTRFVAFVDPRDGSGVYPGGEASEPRRQAGTAF